MFEDSVKDWIKNFLSKQSPAFNNLPPGPFAKQALIDNKIVFHYIEPIYHLTIAEYFKAELENYSYHWPKNKEVVVLGCVPNLITSDELSDTVEYCNEKFLDARGYIALEDHPNEKETVLDVCVNQGKYALVLLQEKLKLSKARRILKKQNYYKYWTDDYYSQVITYDNTD
mgnify:FL=1